MYSYYNNSENSDFIKGYVTTVVTQLIQSQLQKKTALNILDSF